MIKDISEGTRREVTGVRSAVDMETATVWLLRGGAEDMDIHCYLSADGSFGVWTTGGPANADA